jgi:hypothetical protein
MRVRFSIEVSVLVDGEEMVATQLRDRSLSIGSDPSCALLLEAPFAQLELLEALPHGHGYGLHLSPGLRGKLRVGGRTLRVEDGLLADPRPEPLRFGDGDRGVLLIGDRLQLRFTIVKQKRAFAAPFWLPRDRSIGLALGASAAVLLGMVGMIVSRPLPPERRRETFRVIKVSPPLLNRALAQKKRKRPPRPKTHAKGAGSTAAPRAIARGKARRRRTSRKTARARARRTVRSIDRLLSGLTRLPAAASPRVAALPASRTRSGGSSTRLGDPLAALDRLMPTSSAGSPVPGLGGARRLRLSPKRPAQPKRLGQQRAGLTRRQIRTVVARHSAAIRGCYERALLRSRRPVQGTLLVQWRIDNTGRVDQTKVARDRLGRPDLRRCVLREVARWRFPRCGRAGGCRVIYPFEFFARS